MKGLPASQRDKHLVPSVGNKKTCINCRFLSVRMKGLEPPRLSAPDPKSGAAAITPHPRFRNAKDTLLFPPDQILRADTPSRFYLPGKVSVVSLRPRPRGETGKRCGLRSRWCNYLGSSSLPAGTTEAEKALSVFPEGLFRFCGSEAKEITGNDETLPLNFK